MTRRVFVDPWADGTRGRRFTQFADSNEPYKIDFSSDATARGTTVSSVAWTSEGSYTLTIENKALASGVATADISATSDGYGRVKVVATYADGNTKVAWLDITIKDPECHQY